MTWGACSFHCPVLKIREWYEYNLLFLQWESLFNNMASLFYYVTFVRYKYEGNNNLSCWHPNYNGQWKELTVKAKTKEWSCITSLFYTIVHYFITCALTKQSWGDFKFFTDKTNQAKIAIRFTLMVLRNKLFWNQQNDFHSQNIPNVVKHQQEKIQENRVNPNLVFYSGDFSGKSLKPTMMTLEYRLPSFHSCPRVEVLRVPLLILLNNVLVNQRKTWL